MKEASVFIHTFYRKIRRVVLDFAEPESYERLKRHKRHIQYFGRVLSDALILFVFALLITIALLYSTKYLWYLFYSTPIGERSAALYYEDYMAASVLLNSDLFALATRLTVTSYILSLGIGIICQISAISSHFFAGMGHMARIVFFGLPLTLLAALFNSPLEEIGRLDKAFVISLIPTLIVFTGCFRFAMELIPSWADIVALKSQRLSPSRKKNPVVTVLISFTSGLKSALLEIIHLFRKNDRSLSEGQKSPDRHHLGDNRHQDRI